MPDNVNTLDFDLVCFSHLRWNFVFQRPQHLMSRFARHRRVFFIEEPVFAEHSETRLRIETCPKTAVRIATPLMATGLHPAECRAIIARFVQELFRDEGIEQCVAWYYTPMALEYSFVVNPIAMVYDCMDELSLFHNAPPTLQQNERKLLELCDLVFTGGISLFEAKRLKHERVYPFPSSVDAQHFRQARSMPDSAKDQKNLPKPRLGYCGVIDERIDLPLLREMAEQRPEWQFIMVGPVVKIDSSVLPRLPNIHWLGQKDYKDLPSYLAGWDIALMPFALNEATRFISPTKTPEYLAAGLPVISTAIYDVVRQYGQLGLARIATTSGEFLAAADEVLTYGTSLKMRHNTDAYLRTLSWDATWKMMDDLISERVASNTVSSPEVSKSMTASNSGANYV